MKKKTKFCIKKCIFSNYSHHIYCRLETLEDEFRLLSEENASKLSEVESRFENTLKELKETQEESDHLK